MALLVLYPKTELCSTSWAEWDARATFTWETVAPPKLMGDPGWMQRFQEWGYSPRFAAGIGMVELIAAALLLVPSLATYGAGILTLILAGAIYTHLSTGLHSPAFAVQLIFMTARPPGGSTT